MKIFVLAFISIIFSFSTLAEVNKQLVKRMMKRDLNSMQGKGPTPVAFFDNKNPHQTELGQKINLDKFFKAPSNFSAVAMKDGKIVYERYNEKLKANSDFYPHGMSLTKTAVGLTVGHLLCSGEIKSLDDTASTYSPSLKKEPPVLKLAFGFATETSNPVKGCKSNSGWAISSGCSSGFSGLSTSVKKVSICLSGITTSASFTEVSSLRPLSPKAIKITIIKNKARVIKEENPMPAAYLLALNALI